MADLMEATGLEKGGIYRHFPSKEAVAAEAFDYAWEEAFQERVRDLDSITGCVDRLKHLIANFVDRRSSVPADVRSSILPSNPTMGIASCVNGLGKHSASGRISSYQ